MSEPAHRAPAGPPPARGWPDRLLELLVRIAWAGLLGALLIRMPTPVVLVDWMPLKNLVVGICVVVFIGKSLYDTLFYDRYWP